MDASWINLLIQIPLVGIFIWFVLEQDKRAADADNKRDERWREFLKEQRQATEQSMERITNQIEQMSRILAEHDARVSTAVTEMRVAARLRKKLNE